MCRSQALLTGIGQQAAGLTVGMNHQAVSQLRRRYEATGWQAALTEVPRRGGPPQVDGAQRAAVTALACTNQKQVQRLCECGQLAASKQPYNKEYPRGGHLPVATFAS